MAYRPGGPFARMHDSWICEWAHAGLGRTQLLVMLKLCERLEFDEHGHVTAWYPRDELARDLELTEEAVRGAVQRLKRLGFLKVKEAGQRGTATLYTVMPHTKWPPQKRVVMDDHPNPRKGGHYDGHRVVVDDHPLRINSGGGTADADRRPSSSPPSLFEQLEETEYERRVNDLRDERLRRRFGGDHQ